MWGIWLRWAIAVRTIRLPNPPVIAVVDDDNAMREALCDLLQVFAVSCRTFDRACPSG